eukprot:COSAG06_NODE_30_length_31668_cov_6.255084_14_plen_261_part_00
MPREKKPLGRIGGVRQNLPARRRPATSEQPPQRPHSTDGSMRSGSGGGGGGGEFAQRGGWMTTLDRAPYAVDVTDSKKKGNHMVRFDAGSSIDHTVSKDHWMYTRIPTDRAHDKRSGQLFEDTPGHVTVELGGAPSGVTMRQASYDYGANKLLKRPGLNAKPYRDGVSSARQPPKEPRKLKPKPRHVDRNRSAVRIMALPFTDGTDCYDTERWKTSPGCWEGTLREASWASTQPHLKVPKRWVTTTNSMQAGEPGEASFR